jgi:hypothetical protein
MSPINVTEQRVNVTVTQSGAAGLTVNSGVSGISSPHGTYTHSQGVASDTWIITHNLGCKPSVTIVDSGGNVQIGEVLYNNDNQVTVTFSASFSGYAYLN